jgi:hypothetical protein
MIPHLLVFAKFKKSPYWPAKIVKTDGDEKIDVRFFGNDYYNYSSLISINNALET